jgi:hypothetical protein
VNSRGRGGALVIALSIAISGCGGGSGGSGDPSQAAASPATIAKAEANCEQLRRQVVRLGRRAFSGAPVPTETTARIVRPSLVLLEGFARRQQLLAKASGDPTLLLYARLFEPIIVLAHERVSTGERYAGGDTAASTLARGYENLMATVASEQREVARGAGLHACAIDFTSVLTNALTG